MKTPGLRWPSAAHFSGILLAFTFALLSGCGGNASMGGGGSSTAIPAITISSITPKEVPAGSTAVTVTVAGSGFPSDSVIVLNGVAETTTYVSSTQLQATVPATQLQTGQMLALAVRTSGATTNASTGTTLQVDNPIPTVTTLAPAATLIGSGSTTVTITGTNFVSGVVATVNGSPRATTFVSDTQVTMSLPPTDLTAAGTLLVNVTNPQPGGGASGTAPFTVTNPAPTISGLAPSTVQVGAASATVMATGTGFVGGTAILVNGASRPTTYVSGTSVTFALTAADAGSAGSLAVTAVNPGPGGGVSSSAAVTVNNPAPGTITVSPSSVVAGTAGSTLLTVTGTGFVPTTVAQVNGSARSTTYVSTTQLVATLSAADQASAGVLSIAAVNPTPGGGSSPAVNVAVNNPAPGAILVSPNLVSTGTTIPTIITVTGANFVPSTVVQVNGSARATTFISSTQLQSALTVADQVTGGSLSINAFTPAPGGGLSPAASVAVNNPVLGTLTLAPNTVPTGLQNNTTVNVTGSGFVPGTSIQVNGAARATTYVSPTQLTFVLLASDAATTGRLGVTASNPAPSASTSPTAFLTVATPTATPVITSTNPSSFIISNVNSTLYVYGTGFTTTSIVQWNGSNLATSYIYGTVFNGLTYTTAYYLYAQVPASLLGTAGTASVTVYSPTALTSTSNAITMNINNPPVPTLTSISPGAGPIATDTKVTLAGTGFTSSSVVSYNGTPLPTTYVSSGTLTVTIPGSSNLFPGNGNFTVFTPAPGGGTSNAQVFTSYVPFTSNSMVYNPVNGLLYLSVPASVGAPYGNSIVSMDPATGALGTPIPVGSEPNKLALTSDGNYLWVGLDGASGIRRVDLTTNTAGLQFALNTGSNGSPTALALAAMPGSSTSVIVLQGPNTYYSGQLAIYDNGALRGSLANVSYYSGYTLQVDSSRSEIYVGGSGLYTYTYNASGLTAKVSNSNSNIALGSTSLDDMQLVSGQLFGDFGKVYDSESGTLLGTFYQTGTTAAQGATYYDSSLGKVFVLDNNSTYYYSGYNQIQIFSPTDYSANSSVIPINVPYSTTTPSGTYVYFSPHRLVRWGNNGLAFHTAAGVFSLQSNLVKDLSGTVADLRVTASASGGTTTGTQTTYTTTVTNDGPSDATDVALAIQVPSTGVLVSASATSGTCSTSTSGCSFGTLTKGSSVTTTITVLQTTAGTATLNAQVSGSTTDNTTSNNSASASVTVTGNTYNLTPTLTSVSPAAIRTGSADTTITVVGTNFAPGSAVLLGTTVLNTTYTSTTQLTATVPSTSLTTLGYVPVSVSVPAPGGGTSNSVPLTVYSVIALGVNHIAYDDYSRKLMATVSTGSSTVAGNSLVAITPETATIGTPIALTAQPTKLTFSATGQTLWVGLNNTQSIVRYDMLSGAADTISIPNPPNYFSSYVPFATELAVQPGTENTLAMSLGNYYYGTSIYDYSPATKTLTGRSGTSTYYYSGYTCMRFLDATNLFANSDSSSLVNFTVGSSGLTSTTGTSYTLNRFGCFKIVNSKAYAWQGGVASLSSSGTASQIGSFTLPSTYSYSTSGNATVAPDLSIGQVFFSGNTSLASYGYSDGLLSYDSGNYLRNAVLPLNMQAIEGTTSYSVLDLVRWGQDGLALLTSTGHIYLVRGPFVVPQLLNSNSPATISSASSLTHGSGNTLLTITGSNFVPGVAVTWNGSYRTTTITDSAHLSVAIPASDLTAAGTATVVATNPGAAASSALTVTIQ